MLRSELFEPGGRTGQQHHGIYTAAGGHPFPEADLALQQRKDSWRGKSISGNLANGQSVSETDMLMQPRRDDWRGKPGPQPPGAQQGGHVSHPQSLYASHACWSLSNGWGYILQCCSPSYACHLLHVLMSNDTS